jgi:uncharacterized iron-regulated membrane protein
MSTIALSQQDAAPDTRLYRAIWRWHFYAGLFVVPFLLTLAVTGLVILFVTGVAPEYGDWLKVNAQGQALPVQAQADKALAAHEGGKIGQFIAPWGAEYPALVRVDLADGNRMLAVDPYSGAILRDIPQAGTWNEFMTNIHGELLIGDTGGPGDFVVEIAASLGVIMVLSGLYLWWPRNGQSFGAALVPNVQAQGRALWKSLHQTIGAWMSIFLLFFLLSGLAWAGIWGGKFVQAWSTFPAEKWDNVPLSDETHAKMNHGAKKEVPWALEQTLLPESGSQAGIAGLHSDVAVNLTSIHALGRALGFEGRFQIAVPADEKGVWTMSQDSMSYDSTNPTADRTVHVDQYTGKILADVKFADYPVFGKIMAVGIALHEGQLGWWNVAFNTLFCLSVIFACVSGVAMWWKRRPAGKLGAPLYVRDTRIPKPVLGVGAILAAAFPLAGLVIIVFAIVDFFLPKRFKEAGWQRSAS